MRLTVLIVEDSEDDIFLVQAALRQITEFQIDLQIAHDGQEATDYLEGTGIFVGREAHPIPDCIILDLKMPRKNGFDVLEWLREHSQHSLIPTLVLTASEIPSDIQRAYQLGANTYFCKPSTHLELVQMFSRILAYWEIAKRPRKMACEEREPAQTASR